MVKMSSASFLALNLGKYRMKKSYNTAIYISLADYETTSKDVFRTLSSI